MFNKEKFSLLLKKALGDRTTTEYSDQSGVNRTYISKFLNERMDNPPSPEILKRLADAAYNNVTYMQLMEACGYVKEFSNITKETLKDEDFKRILPTILAGIKEMLTKNSSDKDRIFIEKFDIDNYFNILADDNDKAELFNIAISKALYKFPDKNGNDEIEIYSNIKMTENLIPYMKEQYNKFIEIHNNNIKSNDKKEQDLIPEQFTDPDEARAYVNKHQIFGSGGFDADKLDDNEILEFANALLEQMKMVSYKYKK